LNNLTVKGYVEAFCSAFQKYGLPQGYWWNILYGAVSLLILTAICFVGADFFSKANLLILVALVIAIVCAMVSLIFQQRNAIAGYTGFQQILELQIRLMQQHGHLEEHLEFCFLHVQESWLV
jgi:hypothetical protein